jgi:hypothetical protein
MITYYPHQEIDKSKWDECIDHSLPGLPYACSWYLDLVSPGWAGLVLADYRAVMPLPFKQKWRIFYLFKPYFTQQLGIFSPEALPENILHDFIRKIPDRFRYVQTNLNELNHLTEEFKTTTNTNHLIRIDRDYTDIYAGYSRNCRRNIKKAMDAGLTASTNLEASIFVPFVFRNLERQIPRLDREQRVLLEKIIATSRQKLAVSVTGIYTPLQELCAAGLFMQTATRMIFMVCASSLKGKQSDAMYLLVDDQIRKSAGTTTWFDFSGSNMPGIAYFNKSFGATGLVYPTLYLNRLPFPLNMLKK